MIRVGGKQKMSFNQNQAALSNFSIDDSVVAGNIVVETLQRDGKDYLSGDVSVADMFNKPSRLCGRGTSGRTREG